MEELADKVGSNKSNVSRWERGINLPNRETLQKIADLGGMSINELLYGSFPQYAYNLLQADICKAGEYYEHFADRYSRRMLISRDEVDKKTALDYLNSNKEAVLNKIYNDIMILVRNHNLNNKKNPKRDINDALYSDNQVISLAKKAIDEITNYHRSYSEYIEDLEKAIESIGYFGTHYDIQQLTDRYLKKGLDEADAKFYALNDFYISKINTSISSVIELTTEAYNEEKKKLNK